ncbi:cell division protein FtsZ [Hymenobacter sp. BT683]|uniref:Cell division protein FtsZ n=1 Tax=Hymenobacter jeongseonensis TaxID=2791027 RepID=A0ABS0IHS3_9BACT|nr:cell division protein FtsZ [Hymenobacter jeongseonensis]MBF9237909.1 cell division protein FtsZ [Hymenobacter jeongseonensis]
MNYKFDIPAQNKSIIKVIGVGGGGSNAVKHMHKQGIKDVEFIICNTDHQALQSSTVPNKLQIGVDLTEGLGAGAKPERGRQAALESKEQIRELLNHGTKMLFITAGMGGGTGTGAAPVIAQVAQELGILTVGIVTAPFLFEGKKKRLQAELGIKELSEHCDTILVILNDKLPQIYGNLTMSAAFAKADTVLTTAAKSIAEIITVTSDVNVDFEDVKTTMKESGAAVMGSSITEGENRARRAAEEALNSPLLNNTDIHGAQKILLSIMSGAEHELEMDELTEITEYIQEKAGQDAEMIFGHGVDDTLGQCIRVTVIATGFARDAHSINTPGTNGSESVPAAAAPVEVTPVSVAPTAPVAGGSGSAPFVPSFGSAVPEPARVTFDLNGPSAHNAPPLAGIPASAPTEPVLTSSAAPVPTPENRTRPAMDAQALERRRRLQELSNGLPPEAVSQYDTPAYLRRQVKLENVEPSSAQNISRFNLSDDNELLGDNRFLHDNVD